MPDRKLAGSGLLHRFQRSCSVHLHYAHVRLPLPLALSLTCDSPHLPPHLLSLSCGHLTSLSLSPPPSIRPGMGPRGDVLLAPPLPGEVLLLHMDGTNGGLTREWAQVSSGHTAQKHITVAPPQQSRVQQVAMREGEGR